MIAMVVFQMKDNGWNDFVNSGSVSDYLKYKRQEREQAEFTAVKGENNVSFNKGLSNQGTDNRGE